MGRTDRLGKFIQLRDVYGNTYTYGHLKKLSIAYPVPKEKTVSKAQVHKELHLAAPAWILAFALLGAALLGSLGLVAGIFAEKIDQLAAFQNFLILPLTFLSGVFYSIHSLPAFWQRLSHANPFFYLTDGFRYGFLGHSDFPPAASLAVVAASFFVVSLLTLKLLQSGYKLRN